MPPTSIARRLPPKLREGCEALALLREIDEKEAPRS
jgi:hypothetical protein